MTGAFAGKVVIVTGASTGIGAAVSHRFAAGGASVALVGRNEETLRRSARQGPDTGIMLPFIGDVTDSSSISAAISMIVDVWGRLDVLVNNASIVVPGTIEEVSDKDWREVMATDLDSIFYTSRAALPHLRLTRGSIVNVGSVSALRGDWGQAAYNAAKGGMVNLTNAMALDHGHEVRVNAVHPGVTMVNDQMRAVFAEGTPVRDMFLERTPVKDHAIPEDIAAAVAFLASEDARFINGVHLPVDGGLLASNGQPSQVTARGMAEQYFAKLAASGGAPQH